MNLISSVEIGGVERFLLRLAKKLRADCVQMYVCSKTTKVGGMFSEFRSSGIPIEECYQSYFNPLTWLRLWRLMRKVKCDAVCDYTGDFAGIPLLVALFAGVPIRVAWYRNAKAPYRTGIRTIYANVMRGLVKWCATDILANSHANLDGYFPRRRQSDCRFEVIENGVPTDEFIPDPARRKEMRRALGISSDVRLVGHVGSFRPVKNHQAIVEVAARVCRDRSDVQFVLVGDGMLRQDTKEQIQSLGLEDRFIFLGNRPDVADILQAVDVFLFPSYSEGMPNALIEAMLMGVPFVASDVPGIVEAIPDFSRKWTAPATDSAELTKKLLALIDSPDVEFATKVRDWASARYGMDRACKRIRNRLERKKRKRLDPVPAKPSS